MSLYEKEAFKFCMICGAEFETVSDIEKYCANCSYRYFISPKPSAGAIVVNSKKEILVIVRARDPYKGTLDVPAGFCEGSETIEDTLKREMKEEINLDVKQFKYFKSYNGEYDYKGVIKRYLNACFIINVTDEEIKTIKAGDDAAELKWLKPEDINIDEIGFPAAKTRIKDYIDYVKSN